MGTVSNIDCEVEGLGDVLINVSDNQGKCVAITLKDVLFIQGMK